ncbi:hypothetical protein IMSHALPRED_006448 [Imshaugia aleurites]|uniref:Fungal N-terminal domain-containing protein n=1 Tax=Imshaugia aleurites TaxID=172621 RepID=A0A8H3ILJ2_9LECA|nr:hypothetical protein IMSHALPRED_006448 [Imshaugia aleurites]
MPDPLSIASGVAGLVTATAQITLLLTKLTKSVIAAPYQAQIVLTEVSDIGDILSHLQSFLLGLDSPDKSRTSLLKVEKVVTIVSGCVLTFSELEKLLDELKTEGLDILDRLKWARKESAIMGLIQRLQNHKASLSLVLSILNGHTIAEAKDSVDRLHALVEQCYKAMSSRVQALNVLDLQKRDDADWMLGDDTESLATIHAQPQDSSRKEANESELVQFDFADDLQRSQLSNISVINLAITDGEMFNPTRSSQTWSLQPNSGVSADDYVDGQSICSHKVAREPIKAFNSAAIAQAYWPEWPQTQQQSLPGARMLPQIQFREDLNIIPQLEAHQENTTRERLPNDTVPMSTLPPTDPLDPVLHLQAQASSSPQSHELTEEEVVDPSNPVPPMTLDSSFSISESPMEQDEAAYPCKGCGEILEEGKAFELAYQRAIDGI